MDIAIDISPLKFGHSARGVGIYTKNLIEALQKYETGHTYQYFTGSKIPDNVDLVHYPYFDPFFLTLPLFKSKPTVVTVHDLIPIVFPEHFPRGFRGQIKWQVQKNSLRNCRRIITDSYSSKHDIHNLIGYPDNQIDVVYLAPSPVFYTNQTLKENIDIIKKYGLPKRYLLYVGDVNWNKNVTGLLTAFQQVSQQFSNVYLVLIGKAFLDNNLAETQEINNELAALDINNKVLKLGYIEELDLHVLYKSAQCTIVPSYYEGFGLQVLEAMASGCPVVSSLNSSLKEIAGPSLKIDSNDPKTLVSAMNRMLSLGDRSRKKIIENGLIWVAKFTWEKVVYDTMAAYQKILSAL